MPPPAPPRLVNFAALLLRHSGRICNKKPPGGLIDQPGAVRRLSHGRTWQRAGGSRQRAGGFHRVPHCEAMAAAIPGYVLDRSFHRSGPGLARWQSARASAAVISLVGCNGGISPRVQKQVRFFAGSPNCQGCTVKDGFPQVAAAYLCITGFSTATRGALALMQARKNAAPSRMSCHRSRSASHLTPLLQSRVQGGCAITPAHCFPICSRTSP